MRPRSDTVPSSTNPPQSKSIQFRFFSVLESAPEKVLQFGEGNFLRAFVNYWFDVSNERAGWNGKCVLVQPIAPGLAPMINEQEGLFTSRVVKGGKKVKSIRSTNSRI